MAASLDAAQRFMGAGSGGLSYLYGFTRFSAAWMIDNLRLEDFILPQLDLLNRANFGRVTGDAKQKLRGAVFPMEAQ